MKRLEFLRRLSRSSARWHLTLEAQASAIYDGSGIARRERLAPDADLAIHLRERFGAGQRARVDASLDGSRVRLCALPWAAPLGSMASWRSYAAARFEQLGTRSAATSTIRVSDLAPPAMRLGVAAATADIDALGAALGRRLSSVRVALLDRLDALLEKEPQLSGCVVDASSESAWLLLLLNGELQRVRERRLPAVSDGDSALAAALLPAIRSEWASLGQGDELGVLAATGVRAAAVAAIARAEAVATRVIVLSQRTSAGRFGVDLLQRGPPPPRMSWALLGLGLSLLGAACISAYGVVQERRMLSEAQLRASTALAQLAPAPKVRVPETRSALAERRDAHRIAADLHRPWTELFDGLEARSTPTVRLVQMTVDPRFTQLQLQAEARSLGDVLAYAHQLAEVRPFRSVQLTHQEWRNGPAGRVLSARILIRLQHVDERQVRSDGSRGSVPVAESGAAIHPARGLQ